MKDGNSVGGDRNVHNKSDRQILVRGFYLKKIIIINLSGYKNISYIKLALLKILEVKN